MMEGCSVAAARAASHGHAPLCPFHPDAVWPQPVPKTCPGHTSAHILGDKPRTLVHRSFVAVDKNKHKSKNQEGLRSCVRRMSLRRVKTPRVQVQTRNARRVIYRQQVYMGVIIVWEHPAINGGSQ